MNRAKITKIDGGAARVDSPEFELGNYQTLGFLVTNPDGQTLTVTLKGNTEGGTAKAIGFRVRTAAATEFEDAGADGKEIADEGTFYIEVKDTDLAREEYDRVSLHLAADTGEAATAFAVQDNPRYADNE